MAYDAFQKRKVYLDSFAEGLEEFGVRTVMRAFPDVLESVFTVSSEISPSDVSSILKAASSLEGELVLRIWKYLPT